MTISSKRPENLSWASLVLSVIFFGAAFFLGRWSGFFPVSAVAWLSLSGVLIWFVLVVQFHQRSLAEQEKLDMSQLAKDESESGIFQQQGERKALFAVAQRRLEMLEKWFVPSLSVIIALYEIVVGAYLLRSLYALNSLPEAEDIQTNQPLLSAILMTTIAFVSFLISRYATGMSAELKWRPLRAGGSFLLALALSCFALAIALALAHFQKPGMVAVMAYVIPGLMTALGLETALNSVLDIYRPRMKGQYDRSAFDSRLLGVINEPGGVFRSLAGAIDYQFGFEVSHTWFYRLLERWIVALILFGAGVMYLLSCFIVVEPYEHAIIERFGNPLDDSNQPRLVGPGLTVKWPWPIEKAYKYPTEKIIDLNIGYVPKVDEKTGEVVRQKYVLWGKQHYQEEYSILVASEHTGEDLPEGAVPVSIVKVNLPVQYKVKDLYAYLYKHRTPEELLEAICYRELATFMASATVEVDDEGSVGAGSESLLGAGREAAKLHLSKAIQQASDRRNLGIEIVFLGLQGIHPPPEVAPDYQVVIGAGQQKKAAVLQAEAARNDSLSSLAGSVQAANELSDLAAQYRQALEDNDTQKGAELALRLDDAFGLAKGDIFTTLKDAQIYAFEKATIAKATGLRFADQIKAYNAAPQIYKHELQMAAREKGLKDARKYVVIVDPNDTQVFQVDVQDDPGSNLLNFLPDYQESTEK